VALDLRQTLGRPITPAWPRKSTRESPVAEASRSLAQEGVLTASIKAWQPPAPKLPRKPRSTEDEEGDTGQQKRVPPGDVLETETRTDPSR
jgi:hypothetical protein